MAYMPQVPMARVASIEAHGHHLGWAFVSGRIAGAHAAAHNSHGAL